MTVQCIGIDIAVAKPVTMAMNCAGSSLGWQIVAVQPSHFETISRSLSFFKVCGRATHAAIEYPYVGPNDRDAIRLGIVYGRMEVLCEQAGLIVTKAEPSKWQNAMLKQKGCKLPGRDGRKQLSVMRAYSMGVPGCDPENRVKGDDDVADAANISEWGSIQAEMRERMRATREGG